MHGSKKTTDVCYIKNLGLRELVIELEYYNYTYKCNASTSALQQQSNGFSRTELRAGGKSGKRII